MITRLSGRYSTLAANPAKRTRRKKAATTKKAAPKRTAAKRTSTKKGQVRKTARRAYEPKKAAAKKAAVKRVTRKRRPGLRATETKVARLQKKLVELRAQLSGNKELVRELKKLARQKASASKKRRVRKVPAGRSAVKGRKYTVRKARKGTKLVGHAVPSKRKHTTKSGKTMMRTVGYRVAKGSPKKKPPFSIYQTGKGDTAVIKNPRRRKRTMKRKNAKFVIAGVPVVEMAIGSVAAMGVGIASEALIEKYAGNIVPAPLKDISGEIVTAGLAAFAHGQLKNPMHKSIAQFAFIGSVYQLLFKKIEEPVKKGITSFLPDLGGVYFDPSATNGIYMDPMGGEGAVGGMYLNDQTAAPAMGASHHHMGGLGLFEGRSIYG